MLRVCSSEAALSAEARGGIDQETLFVADTTLTDGVELYAFDKQLSDTKEHFQLRNQTPYQITRVVLRFEYRTLENESIDEREVILDVDLSPFGSRQVELPSFDRTRTYRYFRSRTTGKRGGVPFRVYCDVVRFDIAVYP